MDTEEELEEKRIAKEAVAYLNTHDIFVDLRFSQDDPPSAEVADFLEDYLDIAAGGLDLASEIAEDVEGDYLSEQQP